MSHSFILNCCWLTHKFHMHQGRKTWNAKVIFRGAYTGCQEPGLLSLDINDAWWPETVWWLHLTDHDPHILRQIYTPYTHSFATWRHHGGLSKFSGGVVKASEWSLFTKSAQRPVHGSLHQPCTGGEILPSARLEFSRIRVTGGAQKSFRSKFLPRAPEKTHMTHLSHPHTSITRACIRRPYGVFTAAHIMLLIAVSYTGDVGGTCGPSSSAFKLYTTINSLHVNYAYLKTLYNASGVTKMLV